MKTAEEFLNEHGHIPQLTGVGVDHTEYSFIISRETLNELFRVFAESYADEVSRERAVEFGYFVSLQYLGSEPKTPKEVMNKLFNEWLEQKHKS